MSKAPIDVVTTCAVRIILAVGVASLLSAPLFMVIGTITENRNK